MYYKRLKLLTLDGNDSNAKLYKFVWGPWRNGSLGGPGSLLATRNVDTSSNYVCFNDGAGKLVQMMSRTSSGCPYENYEDMGTRGAAWQACTWDPPFFWSSCDMCGPCYLGYSITVRMDPYHIGYPMDIMLPVCGCGPSPDNPRTQRDDKGPDDPCIAGGGYCGGCDSGTAPPGWSNTHCFDEPEEPEEDEPTAPDEVECSSCPQCKKSKTLRGQATCVDGKPCICICRDNLKRYGPAAPFVEECVRKHEMVHYNRYAERKAGTPGGCKESGQGIVPSNDGDHEECKAETVGIRCAETSGVNGCKGLSDKTQRCLCLYKLLKYVGDTATCTGEGIACPGDEQKECETEQKRIRRKLNDLHNKCKNSKWPPADKNGKAD